MYEYEFGIYAIYCSVVDLMWLAVVRGPWKKRRLFLLRFMLFEDRNNFVNDFNAGSLLNQNS